MPSSAAVTSAPAASAALRRARAAVSALFFVNAVLYANLVPRLPEVKDRLGLSNTSFGTALAVLPVGALLAGLFAPVLISRFGSAKVASFGMVGAAAAVLAVPFAGAWPLLAAAMLAIGGLDSIVDVAQNAHGFRVQRLYRRSIVNAFHGVWSIGAVAGGLLGSAAAGLSVSLAVHLAVAGVVFSALAVFSYRFLLPGPEDAERSFADQAPEPTTDAAGATKPGRFLGQGVVSRHALILLAALGVLAACGAFVEDAGSSWGALYLRTDLAASAATGGLAFVALQAAMTAGRLTGDRVVDRFGQRRVARVGGTVIALGMGFALAVPSIATTLIGFALAGLGVATLVPAVMHTADEIPGLPHGLGLTVVSWLLRVGFLLSPPVVGLVADAASLRIALLSVVLAGTVTLMFGRVLIQRARAPRSSAEVNDHGPGEAG